VTYTCERFMNLVRETGHPYVRIGDLERDARYCIAQPHSCHQLVLVTVERGHLSSRTLGRLPGARYEGCQVPGKMQSVVVVNINVGLFVHCTRYCTKKAELTILEQYGLADGGAGSASIALCRDDRNR